MKRINLPMSLSLIAMAISASMSPAFAEGYGLANAKRDKVKLDKWECKRCVVEPGLTGSVGAGIASNDGSDPHFANTTGTDQDGVTGFVQADGSYISESGYRTDFEADKLGYDTGSASVSTGRPGQYNIALGYRGLANYDTNRALTPYSGSLNLPDNWQTGATTGQMTELDASLKPVELGTKRDRFNLAANYQGSFYKADIDYQYEQRSGKRKFSGNMLTNSAMLAQPIDDSSDTLGAKLYFNGDGWLAGINTQISQYKNDHQALSWQNAFSPTFGAAYSGQSAVAPDNKAYRIAGNTQFRSGSNQMLMHVGFSRFTQDQQFLPATINGPTPDLPQASLDGQVDMIEMKLKYTGRITNEFNIRASYDYRDRDNKTQTASYPQVVTDSYFSGYATNLDYDRTRQQANLGAKYRFSRAVYLDVDYRYDHNTYSDLDRNKLNESIIDAKLNYNINPQWKLWLKAKAADRSGGAYVPVDTTDNPSHPLARKTYLADRQHAYYALFASFASESAFSASANIHGAQDDYDDTLIGLTKVDSLGYDVSMHYQANDDLTFNAFVNQDWRDSDQAGTSNFVSPNWFATISDESTVLGAGMAYSNLLDKQLALGLDYSFSDGKSDTEVTQGISTPYQDHYAKRHNVNAYADYQFSDKFGLRFDWIFEQYQDADWQNANLAPDAIPNVLTFGDLGHDYSAHYFGLTLSYQL
ncbi:MtrB/PioB family decaheme-associated outer membrane protein [Shewanella sp. Scap07]|uniref:MtrB/PioB family decaheme-associated outer membrane protein n=1 Tax=Shewanella sp. Scap07 TaxID=2589987 RepID=UPI0015BBD203|nr:MtrB/PioB family decaheme-associated outer membrane protein [Shewanella sp. Scap07]QLE84965.1 MtrB/PioB family decaheme-associated outer membrane protein [Shewanella sp. Scap07]